jgi:hypothetical protein
MIFRPSRARRDDRFLNEKILVFAAGAACGVLGIAFEVGWLVYLAIGVLALGMLLRFLPNRQD